MSKKKNLSLPEKIKKLVCAVGRPEPGVHHIEVVHADGCPAIRTQDLKDCRCDFVVRRITKQ